MTRTCLLLFLISAGQATAAPETAQEQIDHLATFLQTGEVKAALELFDPGIPSFAEIKRNIEALSLLPNTSCTIAVTRTSQTADTVRFETDWTLQTYPVQNGPLLDRRDKVEISLRRIGDTWKIASLSPAAVLGPPDGTIFKRLAALAADLNEKDQTDAVGLFDSHMENYSEIDQDIDALINQNDILCAIDIVSDRQTGDVHTLDLDWYLQLKSRTDGGPVTQRRERVQVTMKQVRGKWKIARIEPRTILSPAVPQ